MELKNIKAVIFDMDGVVVDTEALHLAAEQETCRHFRVEVPPSAWSDFRGRTAEDIFEELIQLSGKKRVDSAVLVEYKTRVYLKTIRGWGKLKKITGFQSFICELKSRGFRLALATSSNREIQLATFQELELASTFPVVVTGDDVKNGKPHPEPYLLAMRKLGMRPGDCAVIEDSFSGIASGKAAGATVIGIATSHSEAELMVSDADHIIAAYSEAYELFGLK